MQVKSREYTNQSYWNEIWNRTAAGSVRVWREDPAVRQQAQLLTGLIEDLGHNRSQVRILEVGCANSFWLPFLANHSRVQIFGVDYSPLGCMQAQYQLQRQDQKGHIWCEDFFALARRDQPYFDLIISFGFVEHFDDPSVALRAMWSLTRPGGMVFANVPNLLGIYGSIQQHIDRQVYDSHVLMNAKSLHNYAIRAGYSDVKAGYLGGAIYFSVLNFLTARRRSMQIAMSGLLRAVRAFDITVGRSLEIAGLNRNNALSSPYLYVVGQKNKLSS